MQFSSPQGLQKQGHTYFRATETPTASTAEIRQGRIEASNVAVAESAVHMVGILRQFEMLQKAVALGSEMGRRAVDEVAKANP
jgi:flagellar basal-body rod protein FlgG